MTTSAKRAQPAAAADARSISQSIAGHVVACDYDRLPASSINAAKTLMIDTLAVGWAGTTAPAPEVHALLRMKAAAPTARSWGFGGRLPARCGNLLKQHFRRRARLRRRQHCTCRYRRAACCTCDG